MKMTIDILPSGKYRVRVWDKNLKKSVSFVHEDRNEAKKLGYAVSETPYDLDTLRGADESRVTSSSKLCMHVNELDEKPVGGKNQAMVEDLRSHLIDEFFEATE